MNPTIWERSNHTAFDTMMLTLGKVMAVLFVIAFVTVIVYIIRTGVKHSKAVKNAPQLTVPARVATKRTDVWGDHAHTSYYATFEFESGDRTEFSLTGEQFGMLAEGDSGRLTFKGPQFLSFER